MIVIEIIGDLIVVKKIFSNLCQFKIPIKININFKINKR